MFDKGRKVSTKISSEDMTKFGSLEGKDTRTSPKGFFSLGARAHDSKGVPVCWKHT